MRGKNLFLWAAVLMMVLGFSVGAKAETEKSAGVSAGVMSNYVWRGLKLSDSWVVQPSMDFGYGAFGANFWANYDGDTGEANETDLTLNYNFTLSKLSLDLGYIYYALDGLADTQEVYLAAGYDFVVSPSLTVYYDFDEGTGGFAVLALGFSHDLSEKVSLSLGASASYLFDNNVVGVDANGEEYSDLHNGEVSASVAVSITDDLSIEPMLAYSFPLSDDAEDMMQATSLAVSGEDDDSVFYGGVTISLSF